MLRILLIALLCTLFTAPLAAAGVSESIPVAALTEAFQALYADLADAHYDLYAHRPKAEYDALFELMLAELDAPLTRYQASNLFQKFAAYGNVAHARIDYDRTPYEEYRAAGGKVFPLHLRIVDGRTYVQNNFSSNPVLDAGSEILAINGEPMADWLERTARHVSADTPYIAHSLLEFLFPMYLWQEAGPVEAFDIEVRDASGDVAAVRVAALSRDEMQQYMDAADENFSLDSTAREARMLGDGIAYLYPGPFYNAENLESPWDNTAFVRFID